MEIESLCDDNVIIYRNFLKQDKAELLTNSTLNGVSEEEWNRLYP